METKEQNEELFAHIVRQLTGEWFQPIECDVILDLDRRRPDIVVYLGDEKLIESGDKEAQEIVNLSMMDRYNFDEQRVGFYINDDPECRKQLELDPETNYVAFYNVDRKPDILQLGDEEDPLDLMKLAFILNTGVVKGTPRWGQRAYSCIYDLRQTALIYYMPKVTSQEAFAEDWRVNLMVEVNKIIQDLSMTFVPIV